jgi:hypothetical protein
MRPSVHRLAALPLLLLALLLAPRPAACAPRASDDEEDEGGGPVNPYDAEMVADPALRTHGWIALFTGFGLLAGGAVTGGIALHLDSELEGDCAGGLCPPDRHEDLETRDALARSSTLLVASGFACTMMGILILAAFAPDVEEAEPAGGEGDQARMSPRLRFGPGSASLEVRF